MFPKRALNMFTSLAVLALVFSQVSVALAAKISFDGETEDHFWDVEFTNVCRDGFIVNAQEKIHYGVAGEIGDQLPFSLQLGSSSPLVRDSLPARIAGGDGIQPRSLANGTRTFFFSSLQSIGTSVDITLERWDHGLLTFHETSDPNEPSDHSIDFDDMQQLTENVSDCLVDNVAPVITITSPLAQNYLQTATLPTTWDVTDDLSGVASSSGMVDSTPVTNGQAVDFFTLLPGAHTLTVNAADNSGNPAQASVTFNIVVTFDSLTASTQRACSMGWISKAGTYKALLERLKEGKLAQTRGNNSDAHEKLREYLRLLKAQKGKSVNQAAFDLLTADANALLNSLPPVKGDDHHDK